MTPKYDILIGIAIDDLWIKPEYYIFTYEEAHSVDDIHISRYKRVQKKIHLFENKTSYINALSARPKLVTTYEKYINEHKEEFHNRWDKLHE